MNPETRAARRLTAWIFMGIVGVGWSGCGESKPEQASSSRFRIVGTLAVGEAPHGIRFSGDGDTAYVALAGEGKIAVVDLDPLRRVGKWEAGNTPLDLLATAEDGWKISQFRDSTLITLDPEGELKNGDGTPRAVGRGPSLFTPTSARGLAYIVSEFADRLTAVDVRTGAVTAVYPTGGRPYPADVMPDGSLAFVPNLDDGTVSVIDLLAGTTVATVDVCEAPPGGALTRDGVSYIVACGGANELAYLNTASFEITGRVTEGVGPRPFSVAITRDGRFGIVNNAEGETVAILDVAKRRIIERLEVGRQPIVVRIHPDGRRVLVSSEVSGSLTVLETPSPPVRHATDGKNEVVVLGMIHDRFRTSERYSESVLRDLIRAIDPDFVLAEIPPNRFEKAGTQFQATGTITEPRVVRFPEYVDVLFPLTREMEFRIVPTAGWNRYMSDFRAARLDSISRDPAWAREWAEYERAVARSDSAVVAGGEPDDPRWIHTDAYDDALEIELSVYNRLFNEELGPGGWDHINASHYANIAAALDAHRGDGKRFLITYGAGHKGWFLRRLRQRRDIVLLDVEPFLDAIGR
ncbi:MAG: YncE family protein [Gemmatimonadota bacterium]